MERVKSCLPYGRQLIDDEDILSVTKVLKSRFLTQGPLVSEFERKLCAYTGAKFCVAVSSGTAALHLAVAALGLKKGGTGITSPITFLASANAFVYNGITPLFADVEAKTINLSPRCLESVIQKNTRVIIPVHFAGRPAAMKEISGIAAQKKCFVIEDAAHAIGSSYPSGGRVGNCRYSDMTIFSFHPVKTITTGEGGAITTNNKRFYEQLCCLRSHGVTRSPRVIKVSPGPWYYEMRQLGFNYRLTDLQAALGISQLRKIGHFIDRRRQIVALYNAAFKGCSSLQPVSTDDSLCAYHLYVVRIDFPELKTSRKEFMEKLLLKGVGSQVHYIPVYRQPYYRRNYTYAFNDYPEAEKYYKECLSLPLFPSMTDKDVSKVVSALTQILR